MLPLRLQIHYWSFVEKIYVKQEQNHKVCSKNQITFLHCGRSTPRMRLQVRLTFSQTLGQVDLWSDAPPGRGFRSGLHLVRLWIRLTFGQMYPPGWGFGSGWHLVRLRSGWHLVRCTPQAETSCGQVWYYFRPGWHLVRSLGQVDIWSDIPPRQRHLVTKHDTTLGQVDIWSDLWVRLTFGKMYPPDRDILWGSVIWL